MTTKRRKLLATVGSVFLLLALGLSARNILEERAAQRRSQELIASLQSQTIDVAETDTQPVVGETDGLSYPLAGLLNLPTLGLELPVLSDMGQDDNLLKVAPCLYLPEGLAEDRLIIGGHNYKNHFGRLDQVPVGAQITYATPDGLATTYQVTESVLLGEDDLPGLLAGEWDLTLFTCTFDRSQRVVLRLTAV